MFCAAGAANGGGKICPVAGGIEELGLWVTKLGGGWRWDIGLFRDVFGGFGSDWEKGGWLGNYTTAS